MDEKIFKKNITRLDSIMTLLSLSAYNLSGASGITNSIISRWQKGTRKLTTRSGAARIVADALLSLDSEKLLEPMLAPYRTNGESINDALTYYLTTDDLPAMPSMATPPELINTGEYITQQRVFLGAKGFHKAALAMFDYVIQLPPGRRIICCAHNGFGLFIDNVPFALAFLSKINGVIKRGTSFLLISRRGYGMENDAHFARFWLVAHLKGIIRSRYYEGDPPDEYFIASIPGYWSGETITDPTAEDNLLTVMYSDQRNNRRIEAHCDTFIRKSEPASQYGFLKKTQGDADNTQVWQPGPLPLWNEPDAGTPDGSFSAICRVPSIGIMTKTEFETVLAKDKPPCMPEYLFREEDAFVQREYIIILCRDDIREGLAKERVQNEPLSALLHRRAFITRDTLAAMLKRLILEMVQNERFEVALLPRSAFAKLELELVCWRNSASVGWLQDGGESVFANDPITSGSFHAAISHTWDRLHKGWKRKALVIQTLHKWLAGKDLDVREPDSAIVRNWDVLPRG